jgi:hypothetical protein
MARRSSVEAAAAPRPRRTPWLWPALALTCAAVVWVASRRDGVQPSAAPRIEIEHLPDAVTRSSSPAVGDRLHVSAGRTEEIRIYLARALELRCRAGSSEAGCDYDGRHVTASLQFTRAGAYQIVIATTTAPTHGDLERDLDAIVGAHGTFQLHTLTVE